MRSRSPVFPLALLAASLPGCAYLRLLRPTVIEQLDPDAARLVDYLPEVDDPNEAIVGRLFAHGGCRARNPGGGSMKGFARDLYGAPRGITVHVFALP